MAHARRLQPILACVLTVLMVSGAALPSPLLWQCRHATRVVTASFTTRPAVMPCRVDGTMAPGTMACCRPHVRTSGKSSRTQHIEQSGCHPILVQMAALPVAALHGTRFTLSRHLAPATSIPANAPAAFLAATTAPPRYRPPLNIGPFHAIALNTRSPRAPPLA